MRGKEGKGGGKRQEWSQGQSEKETETDGDRTKISVPGEQHAVNKCLWKRDMKEESQRQGWNER